MLGAGSGVLVLGLGAGAVSWLCTWWTQVAGAGCLAPVLVIQKGLTPTSGPAGQPAEVS